VLLTINILRGLVLLAIAYQDIRDRLINVLLLIGLFVFNYIYCSVQTNWYNATIQAIENTILISLIFGLTLFYFKKIRQIEHPLSSHLGLGDILFFWAITPLFTPIEYIVLFLIMTFVSTLLGIYFVLTSKANTIPLAGISALIFLFYLLVSLFLPINLNALYI